MSTRPLHPEKRKRKARIRRIMRENFQIRRLGRGRYSVTLRNDDIAARYPALVEACPYETRLAVTAWAMKAICDHAKEGGTFRVLIYHRLGFGPDAYVPLYQAGGMDISNYFDLNPKPEPEK